MQVWMMSKESISSANSHGANKTWSQQIFKIESFNWNNNVGKTDQN